MKISFLDALRTPGKFTRDVSWNMVGLVVIGIGGIFINVLIGRFYGAGTLGIFSQVMTIYVLFSQLATGGIHFSVQKHVPEYSNNLYECVRIISSAFILTSVVSSVVCLLLYASTDWIGAALDSPDVSFGLVLVIPGLFFYALNKILLLSLNGLRHMRLYAVAQTLRVLVYLAGVAAITILDVPSKFIPVVFTLAEILLVLILVPYFYWILPFRTELNPNNWYMRHVKFARKAFVSGFLADVNPRIDILVLGFFTTDAVVGIYSFASMIAEGVAQIPIVIQNNLNPILTRISIKRNYNELHRLIVNSKRLLVPTMAVISLLVMIAYPLAVEYVAAQDVFYQSWPILGILLAGIVITSGYAPFSMYLNQAGHPAYYSLFLLSVVVINVVINILLVPIIGMYGAAIGTCIAFIGSIYLLKLFVRQVECINI